MAVRPVIDFENEPAPNDPVVEATEPYELVRPYSKPTSEEASPPSAVMLAFKVTLVSVIEVGDDVASVGSTAEPVVLIVKSELVAVEDAVSTEAI